MKILVITAHPDDETIGCGGTLARHAAAGDEIRILCLTDGVGARGLDPLIQYNALNLACRIYGVNSFYNPWSLFENEKLDATPLLDLNKYIENLLAYYPAERVYTHCAADLNQDHRRTLESALIACRPLPGSSVRQLLSFCPTTGWHPTQPFSPRYFVNVTDYWPIRERALLDAYPHELKPPPHYRSLDAMLRAAANTANMVGQDGLAEGFEVIRWLD